MSATPLRPVRLRAVLKEKLWGVHDLSPWFEPQPEKTGEVWFEREDGLPLPLLIKFIFTSERLSVQVHPDDDYAAKHENSNGKTEMWHVLRADPGAAIGIGFRETLSKERLREAALSGEIEQLLEWREVAPGDTFLIPAGTVHALGGGLVVCEIQQVSDVTYRLYDYGRPRELHLDRAIDVAEARPHPGREPHRTAGGCRTLAACRYFRTDLVEVAGTVDFTPPAREEMLVAIEGQGALNGSPFRAGQAWLVPPSAPAFLIRAESALLVRASAPDSRHEDNAA